MQNLLTLRWLFIPMLFLVTVTIALADAPCGMIFDEWSEYEITNCDNPFYSVSTMKDYYVNGLLIKNNDVIQTENPIILYKYKGDELIDFYISLYRHEDNDFRFVEENNSYSTYDQLFSAVINVLPEDEARAHFYTEIFASEDDWFYLYEKYPDTNWYDTTNKKLDQFTGEFIADVYNLIYERVYQLADYYRTPLEYGTYTAVYTMDGGGGCDIFSEAKSILDKFMQFIIPTAHACVPRLPETATITFTIAPPLEPAGAPSILFLPGIMGSHLYEEGSFCGLNGEVQLWTSIWPFKNTCKQLRLKTNLAGESINDIYTKPGAVVEAVLGFNLYESFVADLTTWQQEGSIGGYKVVPYDWRLKLNDILKTKLVAGRIVFDVNAHYTDSYLYQSLASLATTTTSEVTIVAHSNGGLLAKYFLDYLKEQNDPLLSRIKNLILVAVPQNGTPEAVISMLHGSGMGPFETVVTQQTARELVTTSAFGHHLLPASSYFSSTGMPVITFSPGAATNDFIEKYGTSISSKDDLHAFLSDTSRQVPAADELGVPPVVDQFLLNYSNEVHAVQSEWQPPETLHVHQVAGTGLYTPIALEYFTNEKCVKRNPLKLFMCVETKPSLSYRVIQNPFGDETVVDLSAIKNEESLQKNYLDLKKYNDFPLRIDRIHRDILEVPELRTFIKNIVSNIDSSYTYLSQTRPAFSEDKKIKTYLYSPLDLTAVHNDGTIVSSTTPRYLGIKYFRFGEVQTIIIPDELRDLVTLKLNGESFGSFTLDIEEWEGSLRLSSKQFKAVPSATSTIVTVPLAESLNETMLMVDYDGDMEIDVAIGVGDDSELIYTETAIDLPSPVAILTPRRPAGSSVRLLPAGLVLGVVDGDDIELERLKKMYDLLVELHRLLVLLKTLKK
jgi:pimeloyl-ACP methyl ester carboxylesterase